MTVYKLTTKDLTTYKGCQWVVGEWKETDGEGDLCGPGWIHAYDDPLVALLHNPMHANIKTPRLWRCEAEGEFKDDRGLKRGHTRMRLIEEIPVPEITLRHRIRYAILCARSVLERGIIPAWDIWADLYMADDQVTDAAAHVLHTTARALNATYADNASHGASWAVTYTAMLAAKYAVDAAVHASYTTAARKVAASNASYTASWAAAHAAAKAAYAESYASHADTSVIHIDFPDLAREACERK